MSKVKEIRPSLGFGRLMDADLLTRATAIHTQMSGNAAFPNPPVDSGTFKAAIDNYNAAISAALDGSQKARADRHKQRAEILSMLRLLGHYVEGACKADMTVFLSSGFLPASTTHRAPQALPQPGIFRIDQGNTGELLLRIRALKGARSYEVRYAPLVNGETPSNWKTTITVETRQATPINNLTPGTIYAFQVRAVNKLGYTDWSSPVSRMCI